MWVLSFVNSACAHRHASVLYPKWHLLPCKSKLEVEVVDSRSTRSMCSHAGSKDMYKKVEVLAPT